jgi:hypothetical protein
MFVDFASFKAAPALWLIASATADIIITVSLVRVLTGKKTGAFAMDHYMNHLILGM